MLVFEYRPGRAQEGPQSRIESVALIALLLVLVDERRVVGHAQAQPVGKLLVPTPLDIESGGIDGTEVLQELLDGADTVGAARNFPAGDRQPSSMSSGGRSLQRMSR